MQHQVVQQLAALPLLPRLYRTAQVVLLLRPLQQVVLLLPSARHSNFARASHAAHITDVSPAKILMQERVTAIAVMTMNTQ